MIRRFLALGLCPAVVACAVAACGLNAGSADGAKPPTTDGDYYECLEQQSAQLLASSPPATLPQGPFAIGLAPAEASQLTASVRASLKASMTRSLDQARASVIANLRCAPLAPKRDDRNYGAMDAGASAPPNPSGGASSVSSTNNQVAGVDEADFVKNDDKYIYVVGKSGFRIIEAWPATNAHEIANVALPGEGRKLFVEGNRAVVYSATPSASVPPYMAKECTYGMDCVPLSDGTETDISIYDLTNRAQPILVRNIHSSSSLIAARRIGNTVHTVLGQPEVATGFDSTPPAYDAKSEASINEAYDALIASNRAQIDGLDVGTILPTWRDSAGAVGQSFFQSSIPDGAALTSVLSLDIASDAAPTATSIVSRPGWIYASPTALYMAVSHSPIAGWGWFDGQSTDDLSTIHKFAFGGQSPSTAYVGTGVAKGHVLNQFSLDERDGFLRVAASTGHPPDPNTHSTLSIFEEKGGKLDVVGQIDDIAPTEDIRSVRFEGDRGYIVTFKKTDPLFVFDLADPRAPKKLGELKIPGFSTYMHMMDATHLLTIGYDAADQGDFAWFTGVLLQIFDVTNPSAPTLTHKETIGTRGSSSEALTNHLAFNYFAPKNLLALPMTICEGGNTNGGYGTDMTFSGLMVYDATVASGFSLRGKVAHPNTAVSGGSPNDYGYYDYGCTNWWSNASSEVKRSVIMDDYVFSISTSRIKVNRLDALATDVKELSIQ